MKAISLSVLLFAAPSAFALPEPNMHFSYQPNEGFAAVNCRHERIRDLPDWRVKCNFLGTEKEFTAHVILREYAKADGNSGVELLYWVTEPGKHPNSPVNFHTTSAFLGFKGNSKLADLSIGQGVENDYASLVLDATVDQGAIHE